MEIRAGFLMRINDGYGEGRGILLKVVMIISPVFLSLPPPMPLSMGGLHSTFAVRRSSCGR